MKTRTATTPDVKANSSTAADQSAFHLRQVIETEQAHHSHILTALDALRRLIPEPDDTGVEAVTLLEMITRHVELHSDAIRSEMTHINSIWPAPETA